MKDHANEVNTIYDAKLKPALVNSDFFESYIRKHLGPQQLANLTLVSKEINDTLNPTMRSTAFTLFKKNKKLVIDNRAELQSARSKLCCLFLVPLLGTLCVTASLLAIPAVVAVKEPLIILFAVFIVIAIGASLASKAGTVRRHYVQSAVNGGIVDPRYIPEHPLTGFEVLEVIDDCLINQGEQIDTDIRRQLETGKLHRNDLEEGLLEADDCVSVAPSSIK